MLLRQELKASDGLFPSAKEEHWFKPLIRTVKCIVETVFGVISSIASLAAL